MHRTIIIKQGVNKRALNILRAQCTQKIKRPLLRNHTGIFSKIIQSILTMPTPERTSQQLTFNFNMGLEPENEIYITGIAGIFPESDSIKELEKNLFNKVDLVTNDERRWRHTIPEIPKSSGKIRNIEKFDASFFNIRYKKAHTLDHMCRLLLERVHECLIDAGVNPRELYNTNTAVIVGACYGESEADWLYDNINKNDSGVTGCTKSSIPAYISDWLGIYGPSYIVDTACSSSIYAVEQGYKLIRDGKCEAAIVSGVNLNLNPCMSLAFARLGVLSMDGRCKCFDEKADGYCRSESIVVVFLQKAKNSRRVHAKLVHAKTNCDGYKEEGITYPSGHMQTLLLTKFYEECGIEPTSVEFIETHGTGSRVGDPEELSAIDRVFCTGRSEPLLIGSIKSNLGHTEPSSGLNAIAKLCIAFNTGYLPPNINYSSPRKMIPGLLEGRMKVVTEKTPWNRGLSGVSNFGFGGANGHVLLENVARQKINGGLPRDDLPRLVCVSGRTESAVARILDDLESRPVDVDEVRLWHAIHQQDIKGHHFRGYTLLRSSLSGSVCLARDIQHFTPVNNRPIWFSYSTLGVHWSTIAFSLMKIPVFAGAMQKCQTALEKVNFNLFSLLYPDKDTIQWENIFLFIGSIAVHIGITDILNIVGIKPDKVISADNELCNAYADGLLSVEDIILAAYSFCSTSNDSEIKQEATDFSSKLQSKSAAVFESHWSKLASAKYSTEIFTNPDSSDELLSSIPTDAILINIGIDKLENGIFSKLHDAKSSIWLLKNDMEITFLLTALGSLYEVGLNPLLANLYPEVKFPVPQSTPMLSHLVEWNHKERWYVTKVDSVNRIWCNERTIRIALAHECNEYLSGHNVDGRIIFPATGYLVLVWETLAALTNRLYLEVSVEFRDVIFLRATSMPKDGDVEFTISLHRKSGCFEVSENGVSLVTGYIKEKSKLQESFRAIPESLHSDTAADNMLLDSKDFYKELSIRGYQYNGLFRGVHSCNVEGTRGSLMWHDNWTTFLDTMLQVNLVAKDTRSLYVPTRIEKISLDVDLHYSIVSKYKSQYQNNSTKLEFISYPHIRKIRAGGVEIRGMHVTAIFKKHPLGIPVFERNLFIPNYSDEQLKLKDVIRTNIQLIFENIQAYKFKSIELVDTEYRDGNLQPIIEGVGDVLADLPLVQAELLVLSKDNLKLASNITVANNKLLSESNAVLVIGANLLDRQNICDEALKSLKKNGFLLSREKADHENLVNNTPKELDIITIHRVESEYFILLRKRAEYCLPAFIEVHIRDESYSWLDEVKSLMNQGRKIVLYSQNEPVNGLLGLVNCLRKEPGGENIFGLLIADTTAPKFNPSLKFYKEQLDKQLALNVYKNGQWGTYRHLLLDKHGKSISDHAYLKPTIIGDLSSLKWLEGHISSDPSLPVQDNKIKIHVYCSALNFRDAVTSTGRVTVEAVARGRLDQECVQGLEASGITNNGSRVMTMSKRCISNLVEADETMTWPVPDEWSLAEAATVPVAYSTVYMALVMVGNIRKGEKILIHAGSGAVGQAAINVALHHGLEVFTTAGTPAKRAFIKRLFPQVKDNQIGNSRDVTFEHMIRRETNGEGVDLVLNSLADDKLQASVKCLREGGRFLEIGKYDVTLNTKVETCFLKSGVSFHGVMLDYIHDDSYLLLRKKIKELVLKGILGGAVRPISYCVFEKEETESAFRYMTAGRHVGKIILKIREENSSSIPMKPKSFPLEAVPRYICDADGVYVLVGGLGGIGLELADWLVLRGARKLLFSSRRGVSHGYQSMRIKIWKSYGTKIQISTEDVATETGCQSMLEMAAAMGPVKAIFNLAVILKDATFQNQNLETFQETVRPKAHATMYLDKYSRKICPGLRNFVVFSSVSCGRGNAGQTNYGYSNSIMERVCEERKRVGLPALAIQWGVIGDVGIVAEMQDNNVQLDIGGTLQQRISSCIEAMDKFLKQDTVIVSSMVIAEKKTAGASSSNIVEVIAQIIGIGDSKTLSRVVPLSEMGMDSVMAVEIQQTLERGYEIFLSAPEIRMLTFTKLLQLTETSEDKPEVDDKTIVSNNNINVEGIQLLMKTFGDEKTASLPFVYLPTLVSKGSENATADVQHNVLFLLPGLENCAETFKLLCSQLEVNACVLQLGINNTSDDMAGIINRLYQTVKNRLPVGAPFLLLGYSFGCLSVIELAAKLENEGYRGTVFCVDGSPEYSTALLRTFLDSSNDHELQNKIIAHVFNIAQSKNDETDTLTAKNSIGTFEEKIQHAIKSSQAKLNYSNQFLSSIAMATYRRVKILFDYDFRSSMKISSPIILLRQKAMPTGFTCGESYGLEEITTGSVTVHCLDGDHATIVENVKCAHFINKIIHENENETPLNTTNKQKIRKKLPYGDN